MFKPDEGLPMVRFIYPRWTSTWAALARADADVYFTSTAGMHVGLLAMFCRSVHKGFVFRLANDRDVDPKNTGIRYWRDRKLYEYGLRRADRILCQNTKQKELLKKNYGLGSSLIRSLVEPPDADYPKDRRSIEVLWVSTLRTQKQPHLAVDLARRLPHRRVSMVGGEDGREAQLYESIHREAERLSNLNFYGYVPYHKVGGLFDRTRVFVNTSKFEGFPNTYLQSWRRGIPVVAFLDPDDLIARQGLGFSVDSMADMVAAVEKLLSDDAEWQACSDRCRRYMEEHHSESVILKPYQDAIQYAYDTKSAR
jgi:glycosyltransferase involved in cell wall biosynthesis